METIQKHFCNEEVQVITYCFNIWSYSPKAVIFVDLEPYIDNNNIEKTKKMKTLVFIYVVLHYIYHLAMRRLINNLILFILFGLRGTCNCSHYVLLNLKIETPALVLLSVP